MEYILHNLQDPNTPSNMNIKINDIYMDKTVTTSDHYNVTWWRYNSIKAHEQ